MSFRVSDVTGGLEPAVVVPPSGDTTGATDTAAMVSVIQNAPSTGIVIGNRGGVYNILAGQIEAALVDKEFVKIVGIGADHLVYTSTAPTRGTVWKAVGGSGSLCGFTAANLAQSARGNGIGGISFDCNNIADYGLKHVSQYGGRWIDIHSRNALIWSYLFTTVALAGVEDTQLNVYDQLSSRQIDGAGGSGGCMKMDSGAAGLGNFSGNDLRQLLLFHKDGDCMFFQDADTNTLQRVTGNQSGGTGRGLVFGGSNGASSGHARDNLLDHCEFVAQIIGLANGFSIPARDNVVILSQGSSNPTITLEAIGTVWVYEQNARILSPRQDNKRSTYIRDDFIFGSTGSLQIGELKWVSVGTITRGGSVTTVHPGVYVLDTSAVSGTVAGIIAAGNATATLEYGAMQFDATYIVKLDQTDANTQVRIGFQNNINSDPDTNGIYFEFLFASGVWKGCCRAAGAQTLTASLGAVDTNWHTFRIRKVPTGIGFSIDGGTELVVMTNIPAAGSSGIPMLQIKNNAAASKTCEIDLFEIEIASIGR